MKKINTLRATVLAAVLATGSTAWATNGMLMEGYGPQALSMGGAAAAYDNGTAGMMNNPATLQLGANGTRADIALGVLGPNVTAMGQKSDGTSYVMPAVGWVKKNDQFSWGVGMFGQGGMGTEFGANAGLMANMRSELGVGRVIFPLAYRVSPQLSVGASLDYSWASMDMQMTTNRANLNGMMDSANPNSSAALGPMGNPSYGRLDFSNSNDFSGAAKSTGWTGKFGAVLEATPALTLGFSHQLKTNLADMTTSATGAKFELYGGSNGTTSMVGKLTIHNFQMPAVTTIGGAYKASPELTLVADIKNIGWSSVMKKFLMTFDAGQPLQFAMDQNWKDQTVVSLGGAYRLNESTVLRAGYSHASNPVPDAYVHPLFPAIVKSHLTAGIGHKFNDQVSMDIAVSHAPKVSVTSGQGAAISHSQTNYQLMLSYRY
ncbi:MAG: outer membrane protein transport protein [Limnohabitans sp.]|nr:outer membrane protein transport protein [Limnohabitans sp.]